MMNEQLTFMTKKFADGRDAFRKKFWYESSLYAAGCAIIPVSVKADIDVNKIKMCKKLLKKEFNVLSSVRGEVMMFIATTMSTMEDPESFVKELSKTYKEIREYFLPSIYLPLTAMIITKDVTPENRSEIIERTKTVYKIMKANHFFLTSASDSSFAAMLAMSNLTDDEISHDTEEIYNYTKKVFPLHPEHSQTIANILALAKGDNEKYVERINDLYNELKGYKKRFGKTYELPVLAILAMLPDDTLDLASTIAEADDYLKTRKGMGFWGIGRKQRLMYAAILTALERIEAIGGDQSTTVLDTAITSVMNLIIAMEVAVACAIISSSASSATSSSSNS